MYEMVCWLVADLRNTPSPAGEEWCVSWGVIWQVLVTLLCGAGQSLLRETVDVGLQARPEWQWAQHDCQHTASLTRQGFDNFT